jgi:hypothetical protein
MRWVCASHPGSFIDEDVHVGAAREPVQGGGTASRRGDPRLVLGAVRPTRRGDELDHRVAVTEGGLVIRDIADRAAVGLERGRR